MNVHFMAEAGPGFEQAPKAINPGTAYIKHLRYAPSLNGDPFGNARTISA